MVTTRQRCRMAGKIVINSLLAQERYIHDFRRPIRTLALEPSFAKRSSKAFICGGMAGSLSLMEKSWMGGFGGFGDVLGKGLGMGGGGSGQHKETVLHEGEGPIWKVEWNSEGLVAWANDYVRRWICSSRPSDRFTMLILFWLLLDRYRIFLSSSHLVSSRLVSSHSDLSIILRALKSMIQTPNV